MRKIFWVLAMLAAAIIVVMPASGVCEEPEYESSDDFEKSKEDFGQEQDEKPPVSFRLDWPDEEEDQNMRWSGFGGGFASYIQLDLSPLDPLTDDRGVDEFNSNPIYAGGLGGFCYFPPDQRGYFFFGGMGFGFTQSESDDISGVDRKAVLSLAGGGVVGEYRHPVGARLELALGAMIGAGSLTLEAKGDDVGPVGDEEWKESESFFLAHPYGGLSLGLTRWMRVEATAGYTFFEADLSGADYRSESTGYKFTDGDLTGGPTYMVRLVFGYWPKRN